MTSASERYQALFLGHPVPSELPSEPHSETPSETPSENPSEVRGEAPSEPTSEPTTEAQVADPGTLGWLELSKKEISSATRSKETTRRPN